MNTIKKHTILRHFLLLGVCAYVSFSIYTKIQSILDSDRTVLTEQIEFEAEENVEEEINFEDQLKVLAAQMEELFVNTDQKYMYYKNIHQYFISSYLEYDTPPPKHSC